MNTQNPADLRKQIKELQAQNPEAVKACVVTGDVVAQDVCEGQKEK